MKILYVITKGTWGGAQKYVFDLATSLPQDLTPIVAFGTVGLLKDKLNEAWVKTIEIPSLGRDINPFLDIKSFFELLSIYRKEKPDIVHLNSSKIGGLGALAARLAGIKKIIFTAHGWAFNEERSFLSKKIIYFISWLTVLSSHKVIVLGNREMEQALAMPFAKKKIVKIANGINPPAFLDRNEARAFIASKVTLPQNADSLPWVVAIGELHKNKGYEYALETIYRSKVPSLYFIIGEGEERDTIEKLIQEKNLQEKVFLLGGYRDIGNAAQYLKAFDVFMLTSVKEGLPYVLIEAGFARLPVLATDVGDVQQIIQNNETGLLVSSKDVDSLAESLGKYLSDENLRNKYAQALYEHVTKNFTLNRMVENSVALYR